MRSRGFGVHSPFAFAFIRDVIGERSYGYYAYPAIERICREPGSGADVRMMKLLFRVACAVRPAGFCALGRGADAARRCIALASSTTDTAAAASAAALWFVGGSASGLPSPEALVAAQAVVVVDGNAALLDALGAAMTDYGMIFRSGDRGIAVGWERLPRQDFPIIF